MPVDTDYCYRKNEQIIYKDLCDGPALIDPYRRTLLKLNFTAQAIWQLLDGGHSAAAIIGILKNEFDIEAKILEKDTVSFLEALFRREMIK